MNPDQGKIVFKVEIHNVNGYSKFQNVKIHNVNGYSKFQNVNIRFN